MPVRISASRRGAFEISQPTDFIKAKYASSRRDIALITLALFAAIIVVVLLVMRYNLLRPIRELLAGARAIGQGDLAHRVIAPGGGNEIAQLASEFNRMAESLAEQRRAAERQGEERLALERELRHSERLASVGRLAAGVAHEMGAPLNVIKGRVEMLRERPDAPVESRERNLDIIGAQADAITDIVRQVLTLARPFNLRREAIEPARLISTVVELIEADAVKSGVRVEVPRNDRRPDFVECDPALLRQSLMNIRINALHAMANGGRLLIDVEPEERRKNGGTFVGLRVSDTGSGIPPENLALFNLRLEGSLYDGRRRRLRRFLRHGGPGRAQPRLSIRPSRRRWRQIGVPLNDLPDDFLLRRAEAGFEGHIPAWEVRSNTVPGKPRRRTRLDQSATDPAHDAVGLFPYQEILRFGQRDYCDFRACGQSRVAEIVQNRLRKLRTVVCDQYFHFGRKKTGARPGCRLAGNFRQTQLELFVLQFPSLFLRPCALKEADMPIHFIKLICMLFP